MVAEIRWLWLWQSIGPVSIAFHTVDLANNIAYREKELNLFNEKGNTGW